MFYDLELLINYTAKIAEIIYYVMIFYLIGMVVMLVTSFIRGMSGD